MMANIIIIKEKKIVFQKTVDIDKLDDEMANIIKDNKLGAIVDVGYNGDDFIKNRITIRIIDIVPRFINTPSPRRLMAGRS